MANLRRNVLLGAVSKTHAGIYNGGFASAFGRITANQAASGTIIGQIAQDVIAQDGAGFAFPAGTWWVRTVPNFTSDAGDGFDDTAKWIAVPSALPGAFTVNNARNCRPTASMTGVAQGATVDVPDFYPTYSPAAPIRTASGLYVPKGTYTDSFSVRYPYGPVNMAGNSRFYDFGSTGMNNGAVVGGFPATAGYRNVRMRFSVSDASMSAYWGLAVGSSASLSVTIFGTTYTITIPDLTHNSYVSGFWTKTIDAGPSTGTPIGDYTAGLTFSSTLTNPGDPAISNTFGWRRDFFVSPRIDIPLPWTVTDGNNVIAGGYIPSQLA